MLLNKLGIKETLEIKLFMEKNEGFKSKTASSVKGKSLAKSLANPCL